MSVNSSGESILRMLGIVKHFGRLRAVDGVSLEVPRGSITALIGPNGAGKTTMINLIAGQETPKKGEIWLDDVRIDGLRPSQIAATGLARTFQNLRLFTNMTARENVMVGRHRHGRTGIIEAISGFPSVASEERRIESDAVSFLHFVNLDFAQSLPAASLSFGHQRLLEIARSAATQPLLLLLDEPAAGLNRVETRDLARLLRRIRGEGTTILLVEHDMTLVMELADLVVVVDHGVKIAEGPPAAVRGDRLVIEAYLGVQS
ncbi:MAG: ABC transporter ATP-binding protein [Dehalococcoidia bacterium]